MIPTATGLRSQLDRALGRRDSVREQLRVAGADIQKLEGEGELLALVETLLQSLVDREVNLSVQAVQRLLTEGLQAVFPDQNLSVLAKVELQRGKVAVDLVTNQVHGSVTIEGGCNDAFGGAVTTIQSVLLRIFILLKRGLRPVLLMDETLPAFDGNYVHNIGAFLALVSKQLGVDILLVTHNQALVDAADHVYRISRKDGAACFERTR